MAMTGGRYELIRRRQAQDQRTRSGLELDVVDHYEGGQRSVKTLSGGESFQASLALALGLADEMQAAAGGLQLDALFVDEGFGSLDEEALEPVSYTHLDVYKRQGLHTSFLSWSGCLPVVSTIWAAPRRVCAAKRTASARGKPQATPPSAMASSTK